MLTLDKVQLLEERIKKAVSLINRLREENASLQEQIQALETHNEELKEYAKSYSHDSELIEMAVAKSLAQLNNIEGLSEERPAEDIAKDTDFEQLDSELSQHESQSNAADDYQSDENPIIGYSDEDEDPLI
ncbi:MAG: hypothetical protein ACQEQU_04450 [Spirochaetota bacterium]